MSKISSESEKRISAEFQARIKELIEEKQCSKLQFSQMTGVGKDVIVRATIYGIVPSLQSLIKLADSLEISIDYLLGETDDETFYKSENPTTFHARLRHIMAEKNLKYSKVAHAMPFPNSYFYDWLREGTYPSLDYLRALALYFGVSIDYLLGRTDYIE